MPAAEEARAVEIAAYQGGCNVEHLAIRQTAAGPRVAARVLCPDGWAASRMLLAAAIQDSQTAGARDLALELRARAPSDEAFAREVFNFVRQNVRFAREQGEVFTSSSYTLAVGFGDCDDHARLAFALLRAGGLPARLAFLHRPGRQPTHVLAVVGLAGRWVWLETTVDARFGEPPIEAAQRLGLRSRNDISGEKVRTMAETELPAIPARFLSANPLERVAKDAEALRRLGALCDGVEVVDGTEPAFRQALAGFQAATGITVDGLLGPQTRAKLASLLPPDEFGTGYLAELAAAPRLTAHLSTRFFQQTAASAARLRALGAEIWGDNLLSVWLAESGLRNVQNHAGAPAYGLNQLFAPQRGNRWPVLESVGFTGSPAEYLALDLADQVPYVERYFVNATGGNVGVLKDVASLYLVNFLPAYAQQAGNPAFVLARRDPAGPSSDAPEEQWATWRAGHKGDIYAWNRGLAGGKDWIEVGDLKRAVAAAQRSAGAYWIEARQRYFAESGDDGERPGRTNVAGLVGSTLVVFGALGALGLASGYVGG